MAPKVKCSRPHCDRPSNVLCKTRRLCKRHCQQAEAAGGVRCECRDHRLKSTDLLTAAGTSSSQTTAVARPSVPLHLQAAEPPTPVAPFSTKHAQPAQRNWQLAAEGWDRQHNAIHAAAGVMGLEKKESEVVRGMAPNLVKVKIWHMAHDDPFIANAVTQPYKASRILRLCSQPDILTFLRADPVEVFDTGERHWVFLGRETPWTVRDNRVLLRVLPDGHRGRRLSVGECLGLATDLAELGISLPKSGTTSSDKKRPAAGPAAPDEQRKRMRRLSDALNETPTHELTPPPPLPARSATRSPRMMAAMSSPGPVDRGGHLRIRPKMEFRMGDKWEAPLVRSQLLRMDSEDIISIGSSDEGDGDVSAQEPARVSIDRPSSNSQAITQSLNAALTSISAITRSHASAAVSTSASSASGSSSVSMSSSSAAASSSSASAPSWHSSTSLSSSSTLSPRIPSANNGSHNGTRNWPSSCFFRSVYEGVRNVHLLMQQRNPSVSRADAFKSTFGCDFGYGESTWRNTIMLFKKGDATIWRQFYDYAFTEDGAWSKYKKCVEKRPPNAKNLPWSDMSAHPGPVATTTRVEDGRYSPATIANTALPTPQDFDPADINGQGSYDVTAGFGGGYIGSHMHPSNNGVDGTRNGDIILSGSAGDFDSGTADFSGSADGFGNGMNSLVGIAEGFVGDVNGHTDDPAAGIRPINDGDGIFADFLANWGGAYGGETLDSTQPMLSDHGAPLNRDHVQDLHSENDLLFEGASEPQATGNEIHAAPAESASSRWTTLFDAVEPQHLHVPSGMSVPPTHLPVSVFSSLAGAFVSDPSSSSLPKMGPAMKEEPAENSTSVLVKKEVVDGPTSLQKGKGRDLSHWSATGSSSTDPICIDDSDED